MTMLAPPIDMSGDWSWEQGTHTFVEDARIPTGPLAVLRGRGASTRLRSPFTGTVHHAQHGDTHVVVGAPADLLALPADVRTALRFGNVQVIVELTAAGVTDAVFPAEGLVRGAAIGTIDVTELVIALRFSAHPAMSSLAVLRELARVVSDPAGANLRAWAGRVTADAALRLVSPAGRPFEHPLPLTLGTHEFVLEPSHDGDLLAAAGLTRAALAAGTTLRSRGDAPLQLATPHGESGVDTIEITAETAYVSASFVDAWFAEQRVEGFARTTRGNRVTPYINGPEYFDALFTELHAVSAENPPALYLAGYSIHHDAVLGPASLPNRTLIDAVRGLEAVGGEARFLALDFLQADPETVVDYEVAALVIAVVASLAGMVIGVAGNSEDMEQANAFGAAAVLALGGLFASMKLGDIVAGMEPNAAAVAALTSGASVAAFDPYPAQLADNWRGDTSEVPLSLVADVIRHFGVFHQKIAVVRNDAGVHAYCGGIDLNPDRLDTREHAIRAPFHDVHARIDGPAVEELARTFMQRWNRNHADTPLSLAAPGSFADPRPDGHDIVQVARTYYQANPEGGGGEPLSFAPVGDSTIFETTLRAIEQARHYIYIEDQYLTPPEPYIDALVAAARRGVRALIVVVPGHPDQPLGLGPRQAFANRMRDVWGDRLRIGNMRNPFSRLQASRTASLGRLILREEVSTTASTITVKPAGRVPKPPFWIAIGKEVMWVTSTASPHDSDGHGGLERAVTLVVERGGSTNLYGDGLGTDPARHEANAAATVIQYAGIYVHSKLTLIDDCFASIGSANINRRGFFSDGECTVFTLREELTHGDNWIRTLRKRLWGELLGVPEAFALAMFDDPLAHLQLFDRPVHAGNRFMPFDAHPFGLDFGGLSAAFTDLDPGLALEFGKVVASLLLVELDSQAIFDTVIDPTSYLEPRR